MKIDIFIASQRHKGKMAASEGDTNRSYGGTYGSTEAVWRQRTTFLPASLLSTKPTMAGLPILFLFLFQGIAAQAQAQAEPTVSPREPTIDRKLDHQFDILHPEL